MDFFEWQDPVRRIMGLAAGGKDVAGSLGGRSIPPNTRDPNQRKLLSVAEETVIASGTCRRPVHLLAGLE